MTSFLASVFIFVFVFVGGMLFIWGPFLFFYEVFLRELMKLLKIKYSSCSRKDFFNRKNIDDLIKAVLDSLKNFMMGSSILFFAPVIIKKYSYNYNSFLVAAVEFIGLVVCFLAILSILIRIIVIFFNEKKFNFFKRAFLVLGVFIIWGIALLFIKIFLLPEFENAMIKSDTCHTLDNVKYCPVIK